MPKIRGFPRIVVLCVVTVATLYGYNQTKEALENYHNRNRECAVRADPIRIRFEDTLFAFPADYKLQILGRCEGFFTPHSCRQPPPRKQFTDKLTGYKIEGFCQSHDESPFVNLSKVEVILNNAEPTLALKALNLPTLSFKLPYIVLNTTQYRNPHCSNFSHHRETLKKRNMEAPLQENGDFTYYTFNGKQADYWSGITTSTALFFSTPVLISCQYSNKRDDSMSNGGQCSLEAMITDDVWLTNVSFNQDDVPPAYWTSFVKELERVVANLIPQKSDIVNHSLCTEEING